MMPLATVERAAPQCPGFLAPADVLAAYCTVTRVPLHELTGPSKRREVSRLRQDCIWLLLDLTSAGSVQIGALMGGRHYTTIIEAAAVVADRLAAEPEYRNRAAPLRDQASAMVEGLRIFAEANRDRLTGGKVKFHLFSTGKISWRQKPAKVSIKGVETVIAAIRAMGLGRRFLREKVEINKEAMLEDRAAAAAIRGVTIGSDGEDFVVEPFETELQGAS